ncbi:hypothetical protein L0U85_02535 [Glycomyces sp. L485]|uniref:hypothetical protein n=1 Tax=Glycomyces sp. L485 TaxID=2909235 RepID=UPI001F4A4A22|nr:hypothetical protein [Glycomyces sp. L485]MCH7229741.1 hypothetical protein [Glycomyces sp. L485]
MRRRIVLQSLALMGALIPDSDTAGGRVGTPQLEIVQSMTATLRSLDSHHGGTHATHSIVAYLQQVAMPMLAGPIAPTIRNQLVSSVAELALLAGWSAFDAGVQGSARVYFAQALELAEEADDASLACETIIATSNQAAIVGDGDEAANAGQAALDAAETIGDPALVGEARMALAHGHALLGDSPEVARLITRSQRDMDRADRPGGPEWISHVGGAWLDGRIAQCLHLVDDRAAAVEAAERTATTARPLPRGQVLNFGHTALVHFAADEPELGSSYAQQALDAAATVQSARVEDYLRRLEVAAARYDSVPEAAELQTALASR